MAWRWWLISFLRAFSSGRGINERPNMFFFVHGRADIHTTTAMEMEMGGRSLLRYLGGSYSCVCGGLGLDGGKDVGLGGGGQGF
jgi:hypothetical protein